jgi:putative endonuclease
MKQKEGQLNELALFCYGGFVGYYIYVLKSDSGRSYIGHSKDIDNRVVEHNSGKNKATRGKGPWRLVYSEEFETRSEAVMRERYYKTVAGRIVLREKGVL